MNETYNLISQHTHQVDLTIPLIISWCVIMIISVSLIYFMHKYNINIIDYVKTHILDSEDSDDENN